MITTESQFKSDTKSDSISVIFDRAFSKVFEKTSYIFISHKHNEKDYVYRLNDILKRYGFEGYIDWQDEEMPALTSPETATRLKDKIIKAKKFILIATEAAIESKWCNWEVGFADAHKFIDHLAIFPIKEDTGNYTGKEYLYCYSSIQIKSEEKKYPLDYFVTYPDGKCIDFRSWLIL